MSLVDLQDGRAKMVYRRGREDCELGSVGRNMSAVAGMGVSLCLSDNFVWLLEDVRHVR
jgi:hypothetical protein